MSQTLADHQSLNQDYPWDLGGYAGSSPQVNWPGNARIAVQLVLNCEEGGENHMLHGDAGSEQFLSDIIGAASYPDRHMSMDSRYEYGSRSGFWRIHQEFQKRNLRLTVFRVGMALARHPQIDQAIREAKYDVGQSWLALDLLSRPLARGSRFQYCRTILYLICAIALMCSLRRELPRRK